MTLTEQLQRMLRFLIAAHDPHIYMLLTPSGFDQLVRQEGWDLLNTAAGKRLEYEYDPREATPPSEAKKAVAAIDDRENHWWPIIDVTLQRHHPELHDKVFLNLRQTSGPEVVLTMGTLLQRIEELQSSEEGAEALALLETRGFDKGVRGEIRGLLDELQQPGAAPVMPKVAPKTREEQELAQKEAWAWFREWSTIARAVIKRSDYRIRLGLEKGTGGRPRKDAAQTEEQEE